MGRLGKGGQMSTRETGLPAERRSWSPLIATGQPVSRSTSLGKGFSELFCIARRARVQDSARSWVHTIYAMAIPRKHGELGDSPGRLVGIHLAQGSMRVPWLGGAQFPGGR